MVDVSWNGFGLVLALFQCSYGYAYTMGRSLVSAFVFMMVLDVFCFGGLVDTWVCAASVLWFQESFMFASVLVELVSCFASS